MRENQLLVIHGRQAKAMALRILEESGIAGRLGRGMRVVLKPNLVTAKDVEQGLGYASLLSSIYAPAIKIWER